jgi:hypothetical protein
LRLRQVALVARDLDPVVEDLCAILGVEVAFNDPAVAVFGLRNAVMSVGDTFLEVVSPVQAGTTAGRYLDRRKGDGGYMVILQVDDLETERRRLSELGVREAWRIDLDDAASSHLHPKDTGGAILSLDWMSPPASWRWAGPGWEEKVRTGVARKIAGVEIQSPDPGALAGRWSRILQRPSQKVGGAGEIHVDDGLIRFVPETDGRGEGVSALVLQITDQARLLAAAEARGRLRDGQIEIGGARIVSVP